MTKISGPFPSLTERTDYGARVFYDNVQRWKTHPRGACPAPYYREQGRVIHQSGETLLYEDAVNGVLYPLQYATAIKGRTLQKAYGKHASKLKEVEAAWGESLGQAKTSYYMMLDRVRQLIRAARAAKRGDIKALKRALGVNKTPLSRRTRQGAKLWLEYHFGWDPLIRDIYQSCYGMCHTSAGGWWKLKSSSGEEDVRDEPFDAGVGKRHWDSVYIHTVMGEYRLVDPNRALLSSLGLINPAAIAWELVPFSFVVDWFIPVEQYLLFFTDRMGYESRNECTTWYAWTEGSSVHEYPWPHWSNYRSKHNGFVMSRTLGIATPKPQFKLFHGFSPVRGATAIALLIGLLKSLR